MFIVFVLGCGCCWWGRVLGGSLRGVGLGGCGYLMGGICENRWILCVRVSRGVLDTWK